MMRGWNNGMKMCKHTHRSAIIVLINVIFTFRTLRVLVAYIISLWILDR